MNEAVVRRLEKDFPAFRFGEHGTIFMGQKCIANVLSGADHTQILAYSRGRVVPGNCVYTAVSEFLTDYLEDMV